MSKHYPKPVPWLGCTEGCTEESQRLCRFYEPIRKKKDSLSGYRNLHCKHCRYLDTSDGDFNKSYVATLCTNPEVIKRFMEE